MTFSVGGDAVPSAFRRIVLFRPDTDQEFGLRAEVLTAGILQTISKITSATDTF
jgi:hypothetical protein